MTNDRMHQIEQCTADLETDSPKWTNQQVFDQVGGNYAELAQYLKKRRAGQLLPVAPEPGGLSQRDILYALQANELERLAALQLDRNEGRLETAGYVEFLRLSDRTTMREPQLRQADQALYREQAHAALEDAVQVYNAGIEATTESAMGVIWAMVQVFAAMQAFTAAYSAQTGPLTSLLTRDGRHGFELPSASETLGMLLSRLPQGHSWQGALLSNTSHAPTIGEAEAALDVVVGTKPLAPRLLTAYLRGFDYE